MTNCFFFFYHQLIELRQEVEQLRETKTRLETQLTNLEAELADTRNRFEMVSCHNPDEITCSNRLNNHK